MHERTEGDGRAELSHLVREIRVGQSPGDGAHVEDAATTVDATCWQEAGHLGSGCRQVAHLVSAHKLCMSIAHVAHVRAAALDMAAAALGCMRLQNVQGSLPPKVHNG